ncbi:Crp/Fnr family transcriptional regulator [Larkinella soli]|uniref:Crp/Fnr family transcriptional regulator n=1 Tax=Larkinella soli TaxID=1770527 RepID=UPI000FFB2416|nr:Crp/Fnr family transcriptional regulator [Larkinella soli]
MKDQLYSQFFNSLLEICPIDEATMELIKPYLVIQKAQKGTQLLSVGDISDKLYYLAKGLARSYYYIQHREATAWIVTDGDFAYSPYSFITQRPSNENIELLEDSTLLFIAYDDLQRLYRTHPSVNFIGRKVVEKYLVVQEERLRSLRMLSAEERYLRFCQLYPTISTRVPIKYIASYLGLSRFTLSRLRGQRMKLPAH